MEIIRSQLDRHRNEKNYSLSTDLTINRFDALQQLERQEPAFLISLAGCLLDLVKNVKGQLLPSPFDSFRMPPQPDELIKVRMR